MGDSLQRTRALEQLKQMQEDMDKKALSEILKKRRIQPPDTFPYSGLGKKIQQKSRSTPLLSRSGKFWKSLATYPSGGVNQTNYPANWLVCYACKCI